MCCFCWLDMYSCGVFALEMGWEKESMSHGCEEDVVKDG